MFRDLVEEEDADKKTEKEQSVRSEAKQDRLMSCKQEERLS